VVELQTNDGFESNGRGLLKVFSGIYAEGRRKTTRNRVLGGPLEIRNQLLPYANQEPYSYSNPFGRMSFENTKSYDAKIIIYVFFSILMYGHKNVRLIKANVIYPSYIGRHGYTAWEIIFIVTALRTLRPAQLNIVTCMSDLEKGFWLLIRFVEQLKIVTTINYSVVDKSHTL
jgi:hypothetical protein